MHAIQGRAWNYAWAWLERLRHRARTRAKPRDFETDAHQQAAHYGPLNRRALGLRIVDVDQIVGSVGRSAEFDAQFHPLRTESAAQERFQRVLKAMKADEQLPPIELYKLRRFYYVLDGHHRVGAARSLGIESLEADVTLFIPSRDSEAVRVFHERRAFELATGLQSIGAARVISYRRLLTEIHDYRRQLADEEGSAVDLQDAARLWYARLFVPAFSRLRGSHLQELYPSLRHADMLASLFEEERHARQHLAQVAAESPGFGASNTNT